jgi:hypothetical protein
MIARHSALGLTLLLAGAAPGLAQESGMQQPVLTSAPIRRDHFAADLGMLELGLSYARRIGRSPFSVGGGLWGAWERRGTFDQTLIEPVGIDLFVRAQPSRLTQIEIGPSLLRYRWADDCSECGGTFAGIQAAAMIGSGKVWIGPTLRVGQVSGRPSEDPETGLIWGVKARLLFSWND